MRNKGLSLLLAAILSFPVTAFTLDIGLNGERVRSWSDAELSSLSYRVPIETGFAEGVSLQEILPLAADAYRLIASSESSRRVWQDNELAEWLARSFLVASSRPGRWDLLIEGDRFADVRSLEMFGEPLEQKRLEVWVSWEGAPLLKQEIEHFARLHGARIKVVEVPKTESKLISVLRAGGTPPDVVMLQSDYLPSLVRSRAIQSLDYLSFRSLVPQGRRAFVLEGNSWAVPFYFDSQLVFYNPQLLPERPALDWTLDDLERLAAAARRNTDVIPMTWNAYSAYWLAAFQLGFGKDSLVEADGSIRIDDAYTLRALEYLLALQNRGLLRIMEREAMISLFTSGRVAVILSGSYSIPMFENLGIDFQVAPYPNNPAGDRALSPFLDFKGWAITRKTHNPVLARRLIQYLTGIGVQQRFPIALSKLPVDKRSWEIMEETNPYYRALARSAGIGTPVPPERAYAVFKNTMWKLLRFLFSAQMGAAEVLERGQAIIDAQLGRDD